jgi:hypothetical protein
MHTCIHAYMHTYIHTYMHTCIHMRRHIYIYNNIFIHIYQTFRWQLGYILLVSPVCLLLKEAVPEGLCNGATFWETFACPASVAERGQKDYFSSEDVESELAKHHLEWLTGDIGGWYVCLRNGYDFGAIWQYQTPEINIQQPHLEAETCIDYFFRISLEKRQKMASIRVGFWWLFLRLFGEFPNIPHCSAVCLCIDGCRH